MPLLERICNSLQSEHNISNLVKLKMWNAMWSLSPIQAHISLINSEPIASESYERNLEQSDKQIKQTYEHSCYQKY